MSWLVQKHVDRWHLASLEKKTSKQINRKLAGLQYLQEPAVNKQQLCRLIRELHDFNDTYYCAFEVYLDHLDRALKYYNFLCLFESLQFVM